MARMRFLCVVALLLVAATHAATPKPPVWPSAYQVLAQSLCTSRIDLAQSDAERSLLLQMGYTIELPYLSSLQPKPLR